jgi:hypothetical protein
MGGLPRRPAGLSEPARALSPVLHPSVCVVNAPARMHPDDLAALADLIAERLRPMIDAPDPPSCPRCGALAWEKPVLLTAAEVARSYGVSAQWVRDHASDLGVLRLGDGPRPRLRFDAERVATALNASAAREGDKGSQQAQVAAATEVARRRRRRSTRTSVQSGPELLPIRGRER